MLCRLTPWLGLGSGAHDVQNRIPFIQHFRLGRCSRSLCTLWLVAFTSPTSLRPICSLSRRAYAVHCMSAYTWSFAQSPRYAAECRRHASERACERRLRPTDARRACTRSVYRVLSDIIRSCQTLFADLQLLYVTVEHQRSSVMSVHRAHGLLVSRQWSAVAVPAARRIGRFKWDSVDHRPYNL
ncbi:hypothetical protein BD414DRAFT_263307 [Trametes punicea]|nr:hypothetical protein BD414DRAFT_263307 [Trametes punicea]